MANKPEYTLKWLFFGFSGRIRRSTYIWSAVFFVALNTYLVMQIVNTPKESAALGVWGLVFFAVFFASTWSSLALSVKRLHDIGYSGFLSIAMFIPMLSLIFFIALCAFPGQATDNEYGETPIAPTK